MISCSPPPSQPLSGSLGLRDPGLGGARRPHPLEPAAHPRKARDAFTQTRLMPTFGPSAGLPTKHRPRIIIAKVQGTSGIASTTRSIDKKRSTDAEFLKTVEVGQYFMTKHTDEFSQFYRASDMS